MENLNYSILEENIKTLVSNDISCNIYLESNSSRSTNKIYKCNGY